MPQELNWNECKLAEQSRSLDCWILVSLVNMDPEGLAKNNGPLTVLDHLMHAKLKLPKNALDVDIVVAPAPNDGPAAEVPPAPDNAPIPDVVSHSDDMPVLDDMLTSDDEPTPKEVPIDFYSVI